LHAALQQRVIASLHRTFHLRLTFGDLAFLIHAVSPSKLHFALLGNIRLFNRGEHFCLALLNAASQLIKYRQKRRASIADEFLALIGLLTRSPILSLECGSRNVSALLEVKAALRYFLSLLSNKWPQRSCISLRNSIP